MEETVRLPLIDSRISGIEGLSAKDASLFKLRKKQAANNAQLIMNRIALLQKEEERSRKKIHQTKEKAQEIISLRIENDRKIKEFMTVHDEEKKIQLRLRRKNLTFEIDTRRHKIEVVEKMKQFRKAGVEELKMQKKVLSTVIIQDQEREFYLKKSKHEIIRQMEEEAKRKKDLEKAEIEKRIKENLLTKIKQEQEEADKAEELVRMLEAKEREWIEKLKESQRLQEKTARKMEEAILGTNILTENTADIQKKLGLNMPPSRRGTEQKSHS